MATPGHGLEPATGLVPVIEIILSPWNQAMLALPVPQVAMAVACRDPWSSLIQPLRTMPPFANAGLSVRSEPGYAFRTFVATGVLVGAGLPCVGGA